MKYLMVLLILFGACSEKPEKIKPVFREQITGQWRNVFLRLDMKSYKNSDSDHVFEVDEKNWESKMGMRPIRTYYWADGTYNLMHLDFKDSVFYNPAGKWSIRGDSIIMRDTFPEVGPTYRYKVAINGKMAEFWGIEDCDNDGKADDLYYATQRRQF
jgi:hypothetical protein